MRQSRGGRDDGFTPPNQEPEVEIPEVRPGVRERRAVDVDLIHENSTFNRLPPAVRNLYAYIDNPPNELGVGGHRTERKVGRSAKCRSAEESAANLICQPSVVGELGPHTLTVYQSLWAGIYSIETSSKHCVQCPRFFAIQATRDYNLRRHGRVATKLMEEALTKYR
jgi:hypothetical protein